MLSGVVLSSLDGAQKFYVRNIILIISSFLYLILIFILIPLLDLRGVAYSQIIQSIFSLVLGWLFLKKQFPKLPVIPYRWDRQSFKEIIGYGFNLQLISIFQLLYEPPTKTFLTIYGSLTFVGYYEMANKMVVKFRELIVSVFTVLVPVYAANYENKSENIKEIYIKSLNYLLFLTTILFAFLIICMPLITFLWLGKYELIFYAFAILLFFASFVNMITVPAYVAYMGIGILKWNIISHFLISIFNLLFCYVLGKSLGGIGVVIGWAISLALGSIIISIMFNQTYGTYFSKVVSKENIKLFAINLLFIIVAILINIFFIVSKDYYLLYVIISIVFMVFITYDLRNNSIMISLFNYSKQILKLKNIKA